MISKQVYWAAASKFGRKELLEAIEPTLMKVTNNRPKENPAAFLLDHTAALFSARHLKNSNSARGTSFELLFGMTLAECGLAFDSMEFQDRRQLRSGKPVDIDFHICNKGARWLVSLKTSLRERWKTMAYECTTMRQWVDQEGLDGDVFTLGVFYRENESDPQAKTAKQCKDATEKVIGVDAIVSPVEEKVFNRAIACIIGGKRLHLAHW